MRFRLNDKQLEHLRPYVKDSSILDLGAADLEGAQLMIDLGARDVLAVDRFEMPRPSSSRITTKRTQFQHLEDTRPVEELDLGFTDRARKADIVDAILETAEADR